MTDYTMKIKEMCDALGSINVTVDEDEMIQICFGGLAQRYGPIWMAICTREKPPSFVDLQSMLMVEKNHVGASRSTHSESQKKRIGLVVVENAVDQHTMVVADKSRIKGTEGLLTTKDPSQAKGITVVQEAGKTKPSIGSIVAGRVIGKASDGKRRPIRTKPGQSRIGKLTMIALYRRLKLNRNRSSLHNEAQGQFDEDENLETERDVVHRFWRIQSCHDKP